MEFAATNPRGSSDLIFKIRSYFLDPIFFSRLQGSAKTRSDLKNKIAGASGIGGEKHKQKSYLGSTPKLDPRLPSDNLGPLISIMLGHLAAPNSYMLGTWFTSPRPPSGCRKRRSAKGVRSLFFVFGTLSATFWSLFLLSCTRLRVPPVALHVSQLISWIL